MYAIQESYPSGLAHKDSITIAMYNIVVTKTEPEMICPVFLFSKLNSILEWEIFSKPTYAQGAIQAILRIWGITGLFGRNDGVIEKLMGSLLIRATRVHIRIPPVKHTTSTMLRILLMNPMILTVIGLFRKHTMLV